MSSKMLMTNDLMNEMPVEFLEVSEPKQTPRQKLASDIASAGGIDVVLGKQPKTKRIIKTKKTASIEVIEPVIEVIEPVIEVIETVIEPVIEVIETVIAKPAEETIASVYKSQCAIITKTKECKAFIEENGGVIQFVEDYKFMLESFDSKEANERIRLLERKYIENDELLQLQTATLKVAKTKIKALEEQLSKCENGGNVEVKETLSHNKHIYTSDAGLGLDTSSCNSYKGTLIPYHKTSLTKNVGEYVWGLKVINKKREHNISYQFQVLKYCKKNIYPTQVKDVNTGIIHKVGGGMIDIATADGVLKIYTMTGLIQQK